MNIHIDIDDDDKIVEKIMRAMIRDVPEHEEKIVERDSKSEPEAPKVEALKVETPAPEIPKRHVGRPRKTSEQMEHDALRNKIFGD